MAGAKRAPADAWLLLQYRLFHRTAEYLQDFTYLVGQGSLEVRDYIDNYTSLLSDAVGEVGDWLKPESPPFAEREGLVSRNEGKLSIGGTTSVEIEIPVECFGRYEENKEMYLSTAGLVRNPAYPIEAPTILLPGQHLSFVPNPVKRQERTAARVNLYSLPAMSGPVTYEGLVWGSFQKNGGTRFPVAAIELKSAIDTNTAPNAE